ncbi:MAG: hypothetical protein EB107_02055, partial [Proteobacteria bacterium]|nr:hypothetical protein [Pseudomonadota bacterium]
MPSFISQVAEQYQPLALGPLVQAAPDAQVSLTLRLLSRAVIDTPADGALAWVAEPSAGLATAGSGTQVTLTGSTAAINAYLSKVDTLQLRKGSQEAWLEYEVKPVVADPTTPAGALASSFVTVLRTSVFETGGTPAERFVWLAQASSGAGLPLVLGEDAISAGSDQVRVFVRGWVAGPNNTEKPGPYALNIVQLADGDTSFTVLNFSDQDGPYSLLIGSASDVSDLFARGGVRLVGAASAGGSAAAPLKIEIAVSQSSFDFFSEDSNRLATRAVVPVQAIANATTTATGLGSRVSISGTRAAIDAYLVAGNVALTAPAGAAPSGAALTVGVADTATGIESRSAVSIQSSAPNA